MGVSYRDVDDGTAREEVGSATLHMYSAESLVTSHNSGALGAQFVPRGFA